MERVTVGKDEIEITLACLPRPQEPHYPCLFKILAPYSRTPKVVLPFCRLTLRVPFACPGYPKGSQCRRVLPRGLAVTQNRAATGQDDSGPGYGWLQQYA